MNRNNLKVKKLDKIFINNITIKNLEPTKKNFINKNSKFSAKGYLNDKKVKIFEVFDKNQGKLREFISNEKRLSKYFPKLISYNDKYIVEEWIQGKTLREANVKSKINDLPTEKIKEIINLMWSTKYEKKVFDYINYIHNRVQKPNNFDLTNVPIRINHNDLSLDNIIITSNGFKIIDNEFLGCSTGWLLNVKNSFIDENYNYQDFISEKDLDKIWNVRKEWSKIENSYSKKIKSFFKTILKKI